MDEKANGKEDDGAKTGRDTRGDTPRGRNLRDTVAGPFPLDVQLGAVGYSNEGTDDRLGSGDGKSERGTDGKPDGGSCPKWVSVSYPPDKEAKDVVPTSATTMAMINTPGESSNRSSEKTPSRMVEVTFCPRAMAPTNSVMVARMPAWTRVRERELTEVAYELATSYGVESVSWGRSMEERTREGVLRWHREPRLICRRKWYRRRRASRDRAFHP